MTDRIVIICRDRVDGVDLRVATRPEHLQWLKAAPFTVDAAGPLMAGDGHTMIGSMLIVESGDMNAVAAWAACDPYARAGLFDAVTIHPWKHLIGQGLPRGAAETAQS